MSHDEHSKDPSLTWSRRDFLLAAGTGAATLGHAAATQSSEPQSACPTGNGTALTPQPLLPLTLGAIRPRGWLLRQLEIQADGLSGYLDEIWPDVGPESGWLGGPGESWERGPYYLDGLIPLAWLLDRPALKTKAQRFVDWTLNNLGPQGMLGPKANTDWWPRMVMLKALAQYQEVTNDPRVVPAMARYFQYQLGAMPQRRLIDWGRFRWQDELWSVLWLYRRTGDDSLLRLAKLLHDQGWDWQKEFATFPFEHKVTALEVARDKHTLTREAAQDRFLFSHGVNLAMALKAPALWSLVSGNPDDARMVNRMLTTLDEFHGLPIGIFSADEHLAGRNPSQGIELCAVVEFMFSLREALAVTGDVALADRLERVAYNALPATFTDDMSAHQYDQQPNQIQCSIAKGPWETNEADANLFGLEPNFGCCTANYHQGWPKLTAGLWMATRDEGLAAVIYAPCEITTSVKQVPVRIEVETGYPFREQVKMTLHPAHPVHFPLKLRVPGFVSGYRIHINSRPVEIPAEQGFVTIERQWQPGDHLDLVFDFQTRAVAGHRGAMSVESGPLLFSLPIRARWHKLHDWGRCADWEAYPESAWNFGLERDSKPTRHEHPMNAVPFSSQTPAVTVSIQARTVPAWTTTGAYAPEPPESAAGSGNPQSLDLIPYGAAKLRITSFPSV